MSVAIVANVADFTALGGDMTSSISIVTANVATELRFSRAAGWVELQFRDNDGQWSRTGTPGVTLGEDGQELTDGGITEHELHLPFDKNAPTKLYVEVAAQPTTLAVTVRPRTR